MRRFGRRRFGRGRFHRRFRRGGFRHRRRGRSRLSGLRIGYRF